MDASVYEILKLRERKRERAKVKWTIPCRDRKLSRNLQTIARR